MPQPKNEDTDLLKKLVVATEWNTKLIEFQILADMSHSHSQMVSAIMEQVDRNEWQASAVMQKPKDPKPGSEWTEEKAREKRAQLLEVSKRLKHDAALFKKMYENELKAVEKLTKEIMPVFKRKYPIIAQKVEEGFDESAEVVIDKCYVCGAPAFAKLKKGYVCRNHFSQEKKKEMMDDAGKPVTPQAQEEVKMVSVEVKKEEVKKDGEEGNPAVQPDKAS